MAADVIGREILAGNYVYYYNNIYTVTYSSEKHVGILIYPTSATSSPRKKIPSKEVCLLPEQEVTMWVLRNGKIK